MENTDQTPALGIFFPTGSVVITVRTLADQQAMLDALEDDGFTASNTIAYSPAEMLAAIDAALPNAGVLASFGKEMQIAKERRDLAAEGCSFLVVTTPDEEAVARIKATVNKLHAPTAQLYGWLVIEELTDRTSDDVQTVSRTTPAST